MGAQSHLTGLICGPPTSLSLSHSSTALVSLSLSLPPSDPPSLPHLLTPSLCVAHNDAGDSAATGELSPSSLHVTERGRVLSDFPPAHSPTPHTPTSLLTSSSTSNVQRKRMLQLNESNPSGIEAIIEAAATIFCLFFVLHSSVLFPPSSPGLRENLLSLSFNFVVLQTCATINAASVTSAVWSEPFASASAFSAHAESVSFPTYLPAWLLHLPGPRKTTKEPRNNSALLSLAEAVTERWAILNLHGFIRSCKAIMACHGESTEQQEWFRRNFNNSFRSQFLKHTAPVFPSFVFEKLAVHISPKKAASQTPQPLIR